MALASHLVVASINVCSTTLFSPFRYVLYYLVFSTWLRSHWWLKFSDQISTDSLRNMCIRFTVQTPRMGLLQWMFNQSTPKSTWASRACFRFLRNKKAYISNHFCKQNPYIFLFPSILIKTLTFHIAIATSNFLVHSLKQSFAGWQNLQEKKSINDDIFVSSINFARIEKCRISQYKNT